MTATNDHLFLVAGYTRELMQPFLIPIDIINEIMNFSYECFPPLFVLKGKVTSFTGDLIQGHGIEYLNIFRKVSSHLNILDMSSNNFLRDMESGWNVSDSGLAITHNFQLPEILHNMLPDIAKECKVYSKCCTAIFSINNHKSSVIVIDQNSIQSNSQKMENEMNGKSTDIINGYRLDLPLPNTRDTYYQLEYDPSACALYALHNAHRYHPNTFLSRLSFNGEENIIGNNSALNWKKMAEKMMDCECAKDGSLLFVPRMLNERKNGHLMFVNRRRGYLFPLESNENKSWIRIKRGNVGKCKSGMCYDSFRDCVYVGSGEYMGDGNVIDLYDFHKNKWFDEIIPKFDAVDYGSRLRPKFWMDDQLLFIGGGRVNSIPNVIFIDLRENRKQWKIFGNQWSEYFDMRNEKKEMISIQRIL